MAEFASDTWVHRGADDYARAIEAELPTGDAWPRDVDGDLMRWVEGCAQIWGDVSAAAEKLLLVESDPRRTYDLLPDWESAFGLPDECNDEVQTLGLRRDALLDRLTVEGAQDKQFFIDQAKGLGYEISIYEYRPLMCGQGRCGETRPDGATTLAWFHCGVSILGQDHFCEITQSGSDDWIWRIGPPQLRFIWKVFVLGERLTWFQCGVGACGHDHMCEFSLATDLECMFRRLKPAHTQVLFDYSAVPVFLATDDGQVLATETGQLLSVNTATVAPAPDTSTALTGADGVSLVTQDGSTLIADGL